MSLLEIRHLHVRYGEAIALSDVSLQVKKGEFVAVVGANGAGKTTLMLAIMGLVRAQGDIFFEGKLLTHFPP